MPHLGPDPTLAELQAYVAQLETERGFVSQTVLDKCLLLGEEIGELFKAIRKSERLLIDETSQVGEVGDELTDVLIYLLSIANRCDVDLETAFRDKEARNHKRTWEVPE
jgi:NTP pyrophosphatase (non-canonical NTP hydrolase)